jgi:hypothetical protein
MALMPILTGMLMLVLVPLLTVRYHVHHRGACEIPADSDAAKPIKLVHFAYYHHHDHSTNAAISRCAVTQPSHVC